MRTIVSVILRCRNYGNERAVCALDKESLNVKFERMPKNTYKKSIRHGSKSNCVPVSSFIKEVLQISADTRNCGIDIRQENKTAIAFFKRRCIFFSCFIHIPRIILDTNSDNIVKYIR